MKTVGLLFLLVWFSLPSFSQLNKQLCKPGEEIVFAFQLKNQKWVSVCKEKNEQYIVYRFGRPGKIELQYPKILDSTSWQQFSFKAYSRGGGKANAALSYAFLYFINNGVAYDIYETWNSEDDQERCGVSVDVKGKTSDLNGILKTRKGSLHSLSDTKIKLEEE